MTDPPAGPPTVLLDLDGTLLDSAALITEHLAAAIAVAGGPVLAPSELVPLVGPPFEEALPLLGLSGEQVAATIAAYRVTYDRDAGRLTPVYPGVVGLLDRLAGFRLAAATSKPEVVATRILDALALAPRFELIGGSDPAAGRVGKAAVVGSVLHRLGLDPARHRVIMVGDRHHDVDGAAEHGIATVGVAWGYAAEPDELAGAVRVAADPDELAALLLAWRDDPGTLDPGPRVQSADGLCTQP